ncbi:MAG: HAD family phosphatase, partial [Longimicrobiales bacterium]|nr:HAD family phosphatase [Longimicrobiales bacterium]
MNSFRTSSPPDSPSPSRRPAIVFDMDGVLADTERLKFRAHRAATEEAGGTLDADGYRQEMGKAHVGVIRAFLSASGLDTSDGAVERYEDRFQEAYRKLLATDLQPMQGARELLATCREQERPLALVTSSERWMAEIVLQEILKGIPAGPRDRTTSDGDTAFDRGAVFQAIVTADDVEKEKPDPEPYLRAIEALLPRDARKPREDTEVGSRNGAEKRPIVAVEDTPAGVT